MKINFTSTRKPALALLALLATLAAGDRAMAQYSSLSDTGVWLMQKIEAFGTVIAANTKTVQTLSLDPGMCKGSLSKAFYYDDNGSPQRVYNTFRIPFGELDESRTEITAAANGNWTIMMHIKDDRPVIRQNTTAPWGTTSVPQNYATVTFAAEDEQVARQAYRAFKWVIRQCQGGDLVLPTSQLEGPVHGSSIEDAIALKDAPATTDSPAGPRRQTTQQAAD